MYAGSGVQAQAVKYTVCHADGLDGTIKFSIITVAAPAANLHVNLETGTGQAGHEDDVLAVDGKCPADGGDPK
jgi:hypothetical protein